MKKQKARLCGIDTLSLVVATVALVFSIYQHFRIEEFDRTIKRPVLAFDVVVNKLKDTYSVSLANRGLTPATITDTRVNGIRHSDLSINQIRESIFDLLRPVLKDDCAETEIGYAGYEAGSTVGVGEKSVIFSVLKKYCKGDVDSHRIFRQFDKNSISIQYCDLSGGNREELIYP